MNGYILESKSIIDSDIWTKPPLYFKVWHYLLLKAEYANTGNLKRGQLFTSMQEIAEACSYFKGYQKIIPSKQEIYKVIKYLRGCNEDDYEGYHDVDYEGYHEGYTKVPMIVTTKVTHGMLVTICNYNKYQDPKSYEVNNDVYYEGDTTFTTKGTTQEKKHNNIINEYKYKEKEEEEIKREIKERRKTAEIVPEGMHFAGAEIVNPVRQHTEEESTYLLKQAHEMFAPIKAGIAIEAQQRIKEREAKYEQRRTDRQTDKRS